MTKVGDIITSDRLGYQWKNKSMKMIYSACVDCGKEQWKYLRNGKPNSPRCRSCGKKRTNIPLIGEAHGRWKGGRYRMANKTTDGYFCVRVYPEDPFYPMANKYGYVLEHRLITAKALGRCLYSWELIHHKNGIKDDNRYPENLEIVSALRNFALDKFCQNCNSRKEIKLLRLQVRELQRQIDGKLI